MSSSENESRKERRWIRRGRSRDRHKKEYVPPSLENQADDFVTSPPMQRGLTSGISTLFRRAGSKDPDRGSDASGVSTSIADSSVRVVNSGATEPDENFVRNQSRIFSNDDSDDSYESRMSVVSRDDQSVLEEQIPIRRYRGFSTSLQSLFLDESLVCASIGCFGLIVSQRTEFLLDVRNRQRGSSRRAGNKAAHRYPSRVISYALFVTIILISGTYIVWGFGSSPALQNYSDGGYDILEDDGQVYYQSNDDDGRFVDDANQVDDDYEAAANDDGAAADANNANDDDNDVNDDQIEQADDNNNQADDNYYGTDDEDNAGRLLRHRIPGVYKVQDCHDDFAKPFLDLLLSEWHRDDHRRLESNAEHGDTGSTIRLVLGIVFLLVLGVVGRRRRMRTRYALLRARAQEDHLFYASGSQAKIDSTEDNYEGACSHTLCGCYPVDPTAEEQDYHEEAVPDSGKKRKHQDFVSRGFRCITASCCGALCKCWLQCFSICALAQEAREIRLLVPPKYQRIDYITHQPFSDYQSSVNDLRRGWLGKTRRKAGILPHVQALSRLSRYILISFTSLLVALSATLLFNPRASFSWPDLIVLIATFVQAFLVLYMIHWIFHKSDLSLDAVIKFFAAGFVIAVPSAFLLEGFLVNIILAVTYTLYALVEFVCGDVFVELVVSHYRLLWILGELINAYVVAAITEEISKYYTFRAVEHPDLIFLTGLDRKHQANEAFDGGIVHYPYGSHQVSKLNRSNSYDSTASRRSTKSAVSETQAWIDRASTDDEFFEDENDVRTHRQKAAALTTGMISVAVGLACAENFLYVFLLGGTAGGDSQGVKEEWIVLFFRSIFPVHALAAAMQSTNMIRKFVECTGDSNDHRIGIGRIILPAVVLHGSFDAVLLGINVYIESAWDTYLEANDGNIEEGVTPYNATVVNIVAWLSITLIMIFGIMWYYREHRNQKLRLKVLEQEEMTAEGPSFSPSKAQPSEVELM